MVEAGPAPAFVVAQAEFLLQFAIVAFDQPALLGQVDRTLARALGRQVGEPVLARLSLAVGPFDDQPGLGPGLAALPVVMRRSDPQRGKARAQGLCRRALPPADLVPVVGGQAGGQRLDGKRFVRWRPADAPAHPTATRAPATGR